MSHRVKTMKKRLSTRGNTIIEVLIAVVIVGLVLTTVASNFSSSVANSSEAEYRQVATRLAQDIIETLRKDKATQPWVTFAATPANGTYCVPTNFTAYTSLTTGANLSTMNVSCAAHVKTTTNPPMSYYRAVTKATSGNLVKYTIYVYWNSGIAGKERSVSVEQVFYRTE